MRYFFRFFVFVEFNPSVFNHTALFTLLAATFFLRAKFDLVSCQLFCPQILVQVKQYFSKAPTLCEVTIPEVSFNFHTPTRL